MPDSLTRSACSLAKSDCIAHKQWGMNVNPLDSFSACWPWRIWSELFLKRPSYSSWCSLYQLQKASVERSFSALKRLKTYGQNRADQGRLSSLAKVSIETERLLKIKTTSTAKSRRTWSRRIGEWTLFTSKGKTMCTLQYILLFILNDCVINYILTITVELWWKIKKSRWSEGAERKRFFSYPL